MDRVQNSFVSSEGIIENTKELVLQAEATVITASGNTGQIDISSYKEALLFLDVTAVGGTASPTLTCFIDTYDFNSAKWYQLPVTITAITATGQTLVPFTNFGETIRLRFTVTGTTPSFTFGASVVAKS